MKRKTGHSHALGFLIRSFHADRSEVGQVSRGDYPNDHRPAHVHVIGPEQEAVFALNCPAGPVTVRENYGCSIKQLSQIAEDLLKHLLGLCEAWRRIHEIE